MVGGAYGDLKPRFDEEDTRQLFLWLERLCKSPWSDDDAANTVQVKGPACLPVWLPVWRPVLLGAPAFVFGSLLTFRCGAPVAGVEL